MTNLQVFFVSMSPIREKRKEKAHLLVDKPLEHIVPQEYFFCLHWEENHKQAECSPLLALKSAL